jgi:hypothetical protein
MGISGPASASQVERPFKATITGATTDIVFAPGFDFVTNPVATSTFNGRCPGGASWLISFSGTGHSTHLGELTWASSHCTLITSLTPPNVAIFSGRLQFVADNGDVLNENYVGVGGLFAEGDQLCTNTAASFNGGTGRFTDASGSAMELGCWPASIQGPVIHDLVIKSAGTLTYDAAHRS